MGFIVLHLIPILMFIAAIVGRMGRTVLGLTAALFLLVFLQPLFADPELHPRWLPIVPRAQRPVHLRPRLPTGETRRRTL